MIEVSGIYLDVPPLIEDAHLVPPGCKAFYITALVDGEEARVVAVLPRALLQIDSRQQGAMWGVALTEAFNQLARLS